MIYDNLEYKAKTVKQNQILISFTNGAKCEIKGSLNKKYHVKFYNDITNKLIHEDIITNNMWTAPNYKSFLKWRIEVWVDGKKDFNHILDLKDKKVYITFNSKSIGDTIAWFPYVEEFRKKHKCEVICSTFHNDWFKSKYPNIEFISIGSKPSLIHASYKIGWFYKNCCFDTSYHLIDFKHQPLQKSASDILGLEYKELTPKIKDLPFSSIKEKYVTLAIQSTAQSKYWNYKEGWQQVVNFLSKQGYKVILVDKHKNFGTRNFMNSAPNGVIDYTYKPLDEIFSTIQSAQFHIGVSSGLSWVAWALNTHVVLISSFTKPWCEFQSNCTRIHNETPTSGYFNTHRLDASDWNWYPFQKIKSMEDWYKIETITPQQVINGIKQIL